nr:cytochrome P450 94A2-like [Ipomoea batatas]
MSRPAASLPEKFLCRVVNVRLQIIAKTSVLIASILTNLIPFFRCFNSHCAAVVRHSCVACAKLASLFKDCFRVRSWVSVAVVPGGEIRSGFEEAVRISSQRFNNVVSHLVWKLKRRFNIGSERKLRAAVEVKTS